MCELSVKGRKRHKMRNFSKIKTKLQKVFTKLLSLVNLAVMSIIMNYLPKSSGKDNFIKSCFCLSCKNVEISFRSFWYNTVEITSQTPQLVLEMWRNTGIHRSSLWSHRPRSFLSHPPRGNQHACSLANVFLGSVATQLRCGGKCMRLEAVIFHDTVWPSLQAALSDRRKCRRHFLRHVIYEEHNGSYTNAVSP